MGRFTKSIKHMFNAFASQPNLQPSVAYGLGGGSYGIQARPHQVRVRVSNERSIISSIYSRLAVDVASAEIKHVRTEQGKYKEDMNSGLNECLTVEANLDQSPRAFLQDLVLTLFDKGVAAIVPVDTSVDPRLTSGWDMRSMRVGEVVAWYPRYVTVRVYNDAHDKGLREDITLEKRLVGIVENPFYTIMNEPNSTLQRLIHKLNLLDSLDEQNSSGKLDMIIQLPYVIKSDARRQQAEKRRTDIEQQLKNGKYGIAYTDGTEKITQLNRPVTNNLLEQVEYLTKMLYSQLGITSEILNGTADEKTMLNYYARVIAPILDAIKEEMIRKFLSKTARSQGQTIVYFKNPFELMPLSELAKVADVLSRNEIVTPNELRQSIGMRPSQDPSADQLANSNMVAGTTPGSIGALPAGSSSDEASGGESSAIDVLESAINDAFADLDIDEDEDAEVG